MSERGIATGSAPKRASRWRRVLLIVFCMLLGLAAGIGYYLHTPKSYQASATVLVLPTATGIDTSAGGSTDINMETEAELARSTWVADEASQALDNRLSASALLKKGSVTVPVNSQVVNFSVVAPSAQLAAEGANAWADAYMQRRKDQATEVLNAATGELQDRYDATQESLNTLDPNTVDAEARRDFLINRLSEIDKQLIALGVGSVVPGKLITSATPPTEPAAPSLPLAVGAGLLAGGALAVILILIVAQRRSQSIPHTEPTMQREVPVLASVSGADFGGPGANEADLRRMCREIAALDAAPGPVALIGGGDPATATGVALQLGSAWASEFGTSVVVSTDSTARDTLPKSVRDLPGVFDLLGNGVSPSDCAARVPDSRALLIGPGNRANVATEVSGQRLAQLWAQLDREFGTVLVSSLQQDNPIASMTIRTAGQVVGIVRADRGRDQDVGVLLNTLDHLSAADRLVGVVLVEDGDLQPRRPGSSPVADPRFVPESVDVAPSNTNPFDPGQDPNETRDGDEVAESVYDQLISRFGSAT